MMVHRLLSLYLSGGASAHKEIYEKLCTHCSEREQLAADAERASTKYKLVEYMLDKVGQEFVGHISGLTDWGMYVELEPTKIEGMVPLREIPTDFFDFDEENYRLVGRRTRQIYYLGDEVKIRVKAASLEQKLLDFEIVPDPDWKSRAGRMAKFTKTSAGKQRSAKTSAGKQRSAKKNVKAKKKARK